MKIKLREVLDLCSQFLQKKGFSASEAQKISTILIEGELRSKSSQGISKLLSPPGFTPNPNAKKIEVKKTQNSLLINGNYHHAMIVGDLAVDRLITLAKKYAISMAAVNGTNTSLGAMGYYTNRLAEAGFIGIAFAGSPAFVAPFGSIQALLGTNPISIAIPNGNTPIVFDMATSEISMYEVARTMMSGKLLPESTAIDAAGKPTKSPEKVLQGGALLPFGNSYKASGLSFMIELLSGLFVGAASGDTKGDKDHGSLLIAISPDSFVERTEFDRNVTEFIGRYHRLSSHSKYSGKLRFPGELPAETKKKAFESGYIDLPEGILHQLKK